MIDAVENFFSHSLFSFHLFKTTKGQMATDMLIVRQNMMRLIPTMNKTFIKPLNYSTINVHNSVYLSFRVSNIKISTNYQSTCCLICLSCLCYKYTCYHATMPTCVTSFSNIILYSILWCYHAEFFSLWDSGSNHMSVRV